MVINMNNLIDKHLGVDLDGDYIIISRYESGKESTEKITEFDLFNRRDLTDIVKEAADCLPKIPAILYYYDVKDIYRIRSEKGISDSRKRHKKENIAIYVPQHNLLVMNIQDNLFVDSIVGDIENKLDIPKITIETKDISTHVTSTYKSLEKKNIEIDVYFLLLAKDNLKSQELKQYSALNPLNLK